MSHDITERRLFAAMAMQGLMSDLGAELNDVESDNLYFVAIAKAAVKLADALIEELDKPVSAEEPPGETL